MECDLVIHTWIICKNYHKKLQLPEQYDAIISTGNQEGRANSTTNFLEKFNELNEVPFIVDCR